MTDLPKPDPVEPSPPPQKLPWMQQKHRGLLWLAFWILFFTTPAVPFTAEFLAQWNPLRGLVPIRSGQLMVASLVAGILGAALILARLYSRTTTQLVVRTVAFGLVIAIFYGILAFVGCMMALKNI